MARPESKLEKCQINMIDNNQYGYKIIKSFINCQKHEAK